MQYGAKYDKVEFSGQIYSWGFIKIYFTFFYVVIHFLGIFESLIDILEF
jgi:hypothetical protein